MKGYVNSAELSSIYSNGRGTLVTADLLLG